LKSRPRDIETTPPEILSDIMKPAASTGRRRSLIKGLDDLLRETLNIPVTVAEDPLTAIARGAGVILEDLDKYRNVLLESEDDAYSNK